MADSRGEDRVVATAHHILRSLSSSHTGDMMRILSTFDDRFSRLSLATSSRNSAGDSPDLGSGDPQSSPSSDDDNANEDVDGNVDRLQSAKKVIMRWDFGAVDTTRRIFLWSERPEEVIAYLQAVDDLHTLASTLSSSFPGDCSIADDADNVLQFAMLRLEAEFCHILQLHSKPADPDWMASLVSSHSTGFSGGFSFGSRSKSRRVEEEVYSAIDKEGQDDDDEDKDEDIAKSHSISDMHEAVTDLYDIALRMLRGGYDKELIQAYVSIRKTVVEESLLNLGHEMLTFEEVQRMPGELVEAEMSKWNQAMKVVIGGLFPSEKQLCERIFVNWQAVSEECFVEVSKPSLMRLFTFGDAIVIYRNAPEKLFKILDMYECLQDLLPSIESMFGGDVKSEAGAVLSRLGDAACRTFAEFESAMQRESSKNPTPGGALHPLCRYVMNYMKFLADYTDTMNKLLLDTTISQGPAADQSPLAAVTLRLTENLEKSLDTKSKLYKDPALSYLFLMNNVHYISQKVKASDVGKLLGDAWIKRNSGKLRQYHNSYRRTSWTKVLVCLRDEGINVSGGSASGASRNVIKERFKNFNAAFEENVKAQCSWIVPDIQLRNELRVSIIEMILPAYRSFLGRFQNHLDVVKHPERYVKYTLEDVEGYLNELFEGSSGSMNKRKSGSSQ